jgi:hypothetical protein
MRSSVLLFAVVACATAPATKAVQERAATSQAPSASLPSTPPPVPELRLHSLNGAAAPVSTNSCPAAFETRPSPSDKAYFEGIKRAVASRWHGRDEVALHDPELKAFGPEDTRATFVEVTLDGSGGLMRVVVTKTSGLNFIDHSAMTAFQEAQPFANPPPDLAKLKCFRFRFFLEIERGVVPALPAMP